MSYILRQLCATLVILVLIKGSQSYFAFPRQGRAMSFYFPRMGRSGTDTELDESKFCCTEGVRRIVTLDKDTFEICPREQKCCSDLIERYKRYKDIVITECAVLEQETPADQVTSKTKLE